MVRKMLTVGVAVASLAAFAQPAFAADKFFNLGDISPGTSQTAQFRHFTKGTTNTATTEVYASNAKAFSDTVLFNIGLDGAGAGVFTVQVLKMGSAFLKNITNGTLTLVNQDTSQTLFDNKALTSGAQFAIPFLAGSYEATIKGNASGKNGGDYQISFAAPVPEPAVVGSMGAGLVLAGFIATRRRRTTTASA